MYAIVRTGGKQYRVERGQRLLIERLPAKEGSDVALEPILYRSEEIVFDKAGLDGVKVTAKVLAHVRGEKLRVFKFKPKRGYKRRTGHRQDLTQIEVTAITAEHAKPAGGRTTRAKPVAADAEVPEAEGAEAKGAQAPEGKGPEVAKAKAAGVGAKGPAASGVKDSEAPTAKSPETSKAKEEAEDGS